MITVQPSILRRMVIGQLMTVILFCLVTAVNLSWEFKKDEGGSEINTEMRIHAQAIANIMNPAVNTNEQMRQKAENAFALIREKDSLFKKELSEDILGETVALRVITLDGREIFRSDGYPFDGISAVQAGASNAAHNGHPWQQFTWRDEQRGLIVQTAQNTLLVDANLCDIVLKFILKPLLWFLPLAALVTFFGVARGLQPLRTLAKSISLRTPNDMNTIDPPKAYAETQPIVSAINALLFKLEVTLEHERHFLADAAHELRTPLAVIQAQAFVLENADTTQAKTAAINELNAGIGRAASLIQKLLLSAKVNMENYSPRLQTVDLCAFVQERMASMAVLAEQKSIDMELTAPQSCNVQLDRETFISAVDNVLDNAIRYTPAGGIIRVTVELVQGNDKVALRIADSGIGIPEELEERVFERFFRIPGTEQNGSGLGLGIVKRVLALHGGDVALSMGLKQRGLAVSLIFPVKQQGCLSPG
jgi:two-component system OmpR family sensor kinase